MSYKIHGGIVREARHPSVGHDFYFVNPDKGYYLGCTPREPVVNLKGAPSGWAFRVSYEGCTYTLEIPKEFLE